MAGRKMRIRSGHGLAVALLGPLALAALGYWVALGLPRPVPEPGAERFDCVSYAPFRLDGESPFDPLARVTPERIEADLRVLSQRTKCVRTYSVDQGLDAVPSVARRLGMQVMLGAWIGRNRANNERELARTVALAREYPDVVKAVIVGNEVLLRRELPEADLVKYIERVRSEVPMPVTYADVWEFWLKHKTVAPAVSFVTIHLLPYWEDEPVGIDAAIEHVVAVYRQMQAALPGREIMIGETGWPSAGRARRDAVPGRVQQAHFIRQFTRVAQAQRIPYNLIEGFDQPWKRRQEGAMGGNWGLHDSQSQAKFPWHGPVVEDPGWWRGLAAGAAGAAVLGWWAVLRRRSLAWPSGLAVHLLAGAAIGAVLAAQWRYMVVWNRDATEWTVTGAFTVAMAAFGWLGAHWLARGAAGDVARAGAPAAEATAAARVVRAGLEASGPAPLPAAAQVVAGWLRRRWPAASAPAPAPGRAPLSHGIEDVTGDGLTGDGLRHALSVLRLVLLFGAAVTVLLHVFDARYRGFPWPLFAVPAATAALLAVAGLRASRDALEERLLAVLIVAGSVVMVGLERVSNPQVLVYTGLLCVFAACSAWPMPRASTSAPSSAPTAEGSKL